MVDVFANTTPENEIWMRKILQKNFKIGANLSTIEKVFPRIVRTFDVQLAGKWSAKTASKMPKLLLLEPKLDGIRLVSRVEDGICKMFSRAGKSITNFDNTIGRTLSAFPNGVYDGEVLDDDFISLMRQVHRKEANVTQSFLTVFDVVSLEEWDSQNTKKPFKERRKFLEDLFTKKYDNVFLGEQVSLVNEESAIKKYHDECVSRGFEGAMAKDPDAPYCFGRGDAVLKIKDTLDADCVVTGFQEGEGKYVGMLGALLVDFQGVTVDIGTGLKDSDRDKIWKNKDFFLGKVAEIRYQEVTEKGSLRFPRFVCWRLDK
jgi:DNA ligase-1